jgi:hypothetical protein
MIFVGLISLPISDIKTNYSLKPFPIGFSAAVVLIIKLCFATMTVFWGVGITNKKEALVA